MFLHILIGSTICVNHWAEYELNQSQLIVGGGLYKRTELKKKKQPEALLKKETVLHDANFNAIEVPESAGHVSTIP